MGTYLLNAETQKLELHFTREEYMALSEDMKRRIKSACLFSRRSGAWVSRGKYPNTYTAEKIAKEIGLEYTGIEGEADFAAQKERSAERAQERADRYEARAERKEREGETLCAPIERVRGDIAFMTQPNINSTAGRAFTRQRERMFAAYDRGMEAYRQSEWYAQQAERLRKESAATPDRGFCERRIKEARHDIKALRNNLAYYDGIAKRVESGEMTAWGNGEPVSIERIEETIARAEMQLAQAMGKEAYYTEMLEAQGGLIYSRENVRAGDMVKIRRYGWYTVIRANPKSVTVDTGHGYSLKFTYGEIDEVKAKTA